MIPDGIDDRLMTCAVCGSRLNWIKTPLGVSGFDHPQHVRADHVAVPVEEAQMGAVEVCDFCLSKDVITEFIAAPTVAHRQHGDHVDVDMEDGVWVACLPCAELVRAGRLEDLINRVTEIFERDFKQRTDSRMLRATYEGIMRGAEVARDQ